MKEQIGDECIYLRIAQLKNGSIQFTDSTNAARLIKEHGPDIRYGSGANGKSTFLNTIMHLLGDYAIATPTESFMKKNGDQNTNDIARLRGTRFVTTTEAEQGRRLSEPLTVIAQWHITSSYAKFEPKWL
ncbi:MAG: hypothetical protein FWH41_02540 [Treponema sp.]|nr:hypothetical protein [Treponema sp.]